MKTHRTSGGLISADPALAVTKAEPEFADWRQIYALFGIRRTLAYTLLGERRIKGVSLRKPGTVRGKRLFSVKSVSDYLNALLHEQEQKGAVAGAKENLPAKEKAA
jgi:hypothetical protein